MPWARWLLIAIPVSWALAGLGAPSLAVFIAAGLAVAPLAAEMGAATEALAARCGPATGGLLNATCGNAAELIVAIVALRAGLVDLVKASLTGSILGNLLLILGLVLVAGGLHRPVVTFNRAVAGTAGAMLLLAVVGLVVPALFAQAHPAAAAEHASAVVVARRGQSDLALHIALGSSTQVALLVAPVVVAAGAILGRPMNLVFTTFEVVAIGLASLIVTVIGLDGESHWFEGAQLLAVYALIAIAVWFI